MRGGRQNPDKFYTWLFPSSQSLAHSYPNITVLKGLLLSAELIAKVGAASIVKLMIRDRKWRGGGWWKGIVAPQTEKLLDGLPQAQYKARNTAI